MSELKITIDKIKSYGITAYKNMYWTTRDKCGLIWVAPYSPVDELIGVLNAGNLIPINEKTYDIHKL